MAEARYTIKYFGWNNEGTSDKVWGWCIVEDRIYNFWGKRLGDLNFKRHDDGYYGSSACWKLVRAKEDKGYKDFTSSPEKVYDDFHSQFKKQLATAIICGKVRNEGFGDE